MQRILGLVFLAAAFTASSALAQAQSFEGLSVSVNVNQVSDHFAQKATYDGTGWGADYESSSSDVELGVQAQFTQALGRRFTLSLGGTLNSGNTIDSWVSQSGQAGYTKVRHSTALFLAPGVAVSDQWLVYAKLAIVSAHPDDALNFDGTGLGVGARFVLSPRWSLQGEVMQQRFPGRTHADVRDVRSSRSPIHLATALVSFGIQYQF